MQSKGAIRLVAILLLIACFWQLSFTLVTALQNNKAKKYAEAAAVAIQETPAFAKVAAEDRPIILTPSRRNSRNGILIPFPMRKFISVTNSRM